MEHILTQCAVPGQQEIWDLAQLTWRKKTGHDFRVSIGDIMSCGTYPTTEYTQESRNTRRRKVEKNDHIRGSPPHLEDKKRESSERQSANDASRDRKPLQILHRPAA